jgi:hypothetical protein
MSVRQITIQEFKGLLKGKIKIVSEIETSKMLSLTFITEDKRKLLIHVSSVYELVNDLID